MTQRTQRPRRAVLYMPATNSKALAKLPQLACDAVIVDLEDAVSPADKASAREALRERFAGPRDFGCELVIRINALSSEWGTEDLLAARGCRPDAILLPKVESPRDVLDADDALDQTDADPKLQLWAMIETPRAMLNLGAIAELGRDNAARLGCLIAGTNDLVKDTGIRATPDRRYLVPLLLQMVLAARAGGFDVLDGVSNNFRDIEAFTAECREGRNFGFDGKTLIHPAQIEPALAAFSPDATEIAEAEAVAAAFAQAENRNAGVISVDGRMVERLHLEQALKVLAKAGRSSS